MNNILDKKFKHHRWYKNQGLTVKQALEGIAECEDIYFTHKRSKIQSDNLFDKTNYDDVLTDRSSTYRLTNEEKEYYFGRKEFWENFKKEMNKEYSNNWIDKDYMEWGRYKEEQKMKVKEYAEYKEAYNKNKQKGSI